MARKPQRFAGMEARVSKCPGCGALLSFAMRRTPRGRTCDAASCKRYRPDLAPHACPPSRMGGRGASDGPCGALGGSAQTPPAPPPGAAASASGPRIYVTDFDSNRIVRIDDMTGSGWVALGSLGPGTNEFHRADRDLRRSFGRIVVADSWNDRVVRVDDMTGHGWKVLGTHGSFLTGGMFLSPQGIGTDPEGTSHMADAHCVWRINAAMSGGLLAGKCFPIKQYDLRASEKSVPGDGGRAGPRRKGSHLPDRQRPGSRRPHRRQQRRRLDRRGAQGPGVAAIEHPPRHRSRFGAPASTWPTPATTGSCEWMTWRATSGRRSAPRAAASISSARQLALPWMHAAESMWPTPATTASCASTT